MAKSKNTTQIEFLRAIFSPLPQGLIELRAIPTRDAVGKKLVRAWTKSPREIAEFTEKFGQRGSQYGVYFGVCKRGREGGKKQDIVGATCLWADIDTVSNGQDLDKVLELIGRLPKNLTPSVVVKSGGGLHLYWVLDRPQNMEPTATQEYRDPVGDVEAANRIMMELVGGDNVADVTRMMRLPGSFNNKRRPEKQCEVVYCAEHLTYDIHDLMDAALSHTAVISGNQWVPRRFVNKQEMDKRNDTEEVKVTDFMRHFKGRSGAVLDKLWRDRVRQHAPRGYMGIHEAIVVTTARLHCTGEYTPEEIVKKCIEWVKQVPDIDTEGWNWEAEAKKIRATLDSWGPKWKQMQKEQRKNGKDLSRNIVEKPGTARHRASSSGSRP